MGAMAIPRRSRPLLSKHLSSYTLRSSSDQYVALWQIPSKLTDMWALGRERLSHWRPGLSRWQPPALAECRNQCTDNKRDKLKQARSKKRTLCLAVEHVYHIDYISVYK